MTSTILEAIDNQIAQLQQARAIIVGSNPLHSVEKPRRGRPKGSKNAEEASSTRPKRVLSAEGRARIAAAQKKRHAARKRAAKKAAAEEAAAE